MTIDDRRARYDHLNAETDRLRAEVERLREDAARSQKLYDERQDDWIAERENLQTLNMQLVKNHDAMQAERDAARAEAEKLRDKAELLDEIITNRISLSYRDGIPVTAHIWSARTDNGFGTGNTLPEALAALRAAKAGGK